jgi:hypothetical protein
MARVPFVQRDTMTPQGQRAWDEIEGSRGGVARNYAAILNNPAAAGAYATLGGYARFESSLDPRVKAWRCSPPPGRRRATMSGR